MVKNGEKKERRRKKVERIKMEQFTLHSQQ
jgi:hypothetical protein